MAHPPAESQRRHQYSMKNAIPLIMAVIFGLAAVFAVNRTLARKSGLSQKTQMVVVANRELAAGAKLESGVCGSVRIPESAYLPGRHVLASSIPRIEGLSVAHKIAMGSHILWDDIDTGAGGQQVGKGEFMVDISFQSSPLLSHLKPLDEIAIAAMQTVEEEVRSGTNLDAVRVRRVQRLSVLFPCVKVLRVSGGTVSVSAPPEKALQLQMASLSFPLYPLLRRAGDRENMTVGVGGSVAGSDLSVENLAAKQ